ncbi:MAG: chorismate mutase [Rhizobiales bacterium]|nr:chorismate mutase [Hyphomicrobiales bacterium]MBI3674573.1 chorismate mutase [Hyphomicrobiales bacterium]
MSKIKTHTTMADIRNAIDQVDERLIQLLAERQRLVERAIEVKKRDGIPARVPQRIEEVIDHVRNLARAHKLDPVMVEAMWTEMVEWFVAYEESALKSN